MRSTRSRQQQSQPAKSRGQTKSATRKKKEEVSSDEEVKVNKSVQRNTKSPATTRNRYSASQQNSVVYEKGSYVAFIDSSVSMENFKVARLLEDLKDSDDEVQVDIYDEMAPLTYQRQATKQIIFEYSIICDVTVQEVQQQKRGAKPQVKITKQQQNKVKKHIENTLQRIEDEERNKEQENEDDSDQSESDEEEQEDQDEEDEETSRMQKDDVETISKRRIVKGKASQKTSAAKKSQVKKDSDKKQQPSAKKAVQKKGTAKKSKKESEDEMDDEEDKDVVIEEESEEAVMIDTSSKRKRAPPKKTLKKDEAMPKVGQKRIRTASKKKQDYSEDMDEGDESNFNEVSESNEDNSQPVKKRKIAAGKAKAVKQPKGKKAPRRPKEFKKGKWNPDIQLVEEDKYKESPKSELFLECCIRCNNKNIIRAGVTHNENLLKKGIAETLKISSLVAYWSPDNYNTGLEYMVKNNNHHMLEILLHPKLKVPAHSTYEQEREVFYNKRTTNPKYLIEYVDTGMVGKMAYGTRVRKVQQSRGNRQGNNAFLEYQDNPTRSPTQQITNEFFIKSLFYSRTVEYETFKQIYKLLPNIEATLQSYVYEAVRAGNRQIAYEIIGNLIKHPNWGFNQLHQDVLSEDAVLEKVLKQSTTKKANTNRDLTPLHCACINPNPKYLKALLDVGPDLETSDSDMRRPIHYAAACEGDEPLKLLIATGISLTSTDNQKMTCLHVAAKAGRAHNIRLILQSAPNLLNLKDRKNNQAMVYACKYGHIEAVKALLEFKAKVNGLSGLSRMPPLSWAATYGHYDLCEFLLDNKARVLSKDKFQRTPLIMAVRNGHTKIASLLLQRGSEWNHSDSSKNTALHYAASYGWIDCLDLLLKAGADVNSQNSWKITPINIAMLMNHLGCVKRLLEEPNVDVNGKDEKGRTLIMLSLIVLDEESYDFIAYLLRKGADPNIQDLEGQTSLHYIAKYQPKYDHLNNYLNNQDANFETQKKQHFQRQIEIQKKITQLLIQNNADLTIKDNEKKTPFAICLDSDNAPLLEFLQDKVSINKEPELFFSFTSKIFNEEYQRILEILLLNDPPVKDTINVLDDSGKTPFLAYILQFTQQYNHIFQTIQYKINQQSFLYGNERQKYKIANADIFDKFPDTTNYYNYNYNFTQEEKNELTHQFLDEIIVKPFIKILRFLIDQGADPQAQIQKLKVYRDIELQKKQLFANMQEGQDIKMEAEEKVKKREEVLEERNAKYGYGRGKAGGKAPRKQVYNPYGGLPNFNNPLAQQQEHIRPTYDVINGEKVLREYGKDGLQNALHVIVAQPQRRLFDYLIELKINPDQPDYDEKTPFNFISKWTGVRAMPERTYVFDKMLDLDVRIDFPDRNGRTPFLNFYENSQMDLAYQMLDMGANINQMDTSGMFAMKYALLRRQNNLIQDLLDRGANINLTDNKGRNLLHHAINMSSATADATFETEQFLIDNGIVINHLDHHKRTPMHYAFVKIQDWKRTDQIDPIETVSSLCGCKGLELDIPDKWMKTPLHYASQRGASICAMYLVQRGANIEAKDIYGNTPLGVGLQNRHYNYGIILIQKHASVLPLVYKEDYEKIEKMWEEQKKQANGNHEKNPFENTDVDMEKESYAKHKKKKHQNMFNQKVINYDYDNEDDYGDEYDEEDEDYNPTMIHQENVFNQQNVFNQPVYAIPQQVTANAFGGFSFGFGAQPAQSAVKTRATAPLAQQAESLVLKEDEEGVSMFKLAIRGAQQGLAYLMLDNNYDLMLAAQDAMDEKKFMLVLTLLQKNPNDEIIQQKNNKGQNLFHILSMNAQGCSFEHLKRIYETLLKRGVDCQAKDNFGRTALHYAVISKSLELVRMLLQSSGGEKYNPNEVDHYGHTPMSLCLEGEAAQAQFYNPILIVENIFVLLAKSGADVNCVYPEKLYKPAFKEDEVDEQFMDNYDPKGKYLCTPLINLIRLNPTNETLRNNLIGLIEYGAKLNVLDSDGRDPIMHAIMTDNAMVVRILLENKKALNVNQQGQDKAGKSAVHYVVNPVKYGSYENLEILRLLHKYGFNLMLKDAQGKTPAVYAQQQESGVMIKELAKLAGLEQQLENFQRALSMIESQNWRQPVVDFEIDAETFMELAKEREAKKQKDEDQRIPVDQTGKFSKSYKVYYDENDKPWDVYLTKVDLKNGIYGDYVFYKMQLLHDSNRDLYVVFTRWGRIGETGMNQRNPFNDLEDAKNDFRKVFKSKTGGNNFDDLSTFSRVKKKYNLARVNYVTANYKDYLQPFDFDKCPKSKLGQEIYELFEEVSNVTMYQRAIQSFGIDTDVLPFSSVKKESLVEARQILMEIVECINEDINISKEGIRADYEKLTAIKEKISDLTSRYYELIPLSQYKDQIAPPLQNHHMVKTQYDMLEGLTNIEYAAKMLLGALLRQKEMNPIDYMYHALNLEIQPLDVEAPEYEVIRKYIDNTKGDYSPQNFGGFGFGNWGVQQKFDEQYEIANVFKIQRKGEAEMINAYKDVPNHFLLYHGSQLFNFIGILSQGLRIAPPEAPPTGYMFGKGVYFADMFEKSFNYAMANMQQQESCLMLMCEVVLGQSKELYQAEFVEKLEHPYMSVKGCGRRGPGYKHTLVCPNGVKVPFGKVINYHENNVEMQRKLMLQHNEYIVYNTQQVRMRYLIQVKKKDPKKQNK